MLTVGGPADNTLLLAWLPSEAGTNLAPQQNPDLRTTNWVTVRIGPRDAVLYGRNQIARHCGRDLPVVVWAHMLPGTAQPAARFSQADVTETRFTQLAIVRLHKLLYRGLAFIVISFLTAIALGAHAAADSVDSKALDGSWVPVTAELGGAPMPQKIVKAILLKIHKGEYEVTIGGEPGVDSGRCAVDTASNPKAMTITGVAGPNAGKTFPAIYELDGDTLRICYDLSGAKRPTGFKTVKGTKLYLVVYHRRS